MKTMGILLSLLNNAQHIYLFRSDVLSINKHLIKKSHFSKLMKVGHSVRFLVFEQCDLHHSETFMSVILGSMDKGQVLQVKLKSPRLTTGDNNLASLRRCVKQHVNPNPRLSLLMDLHALENSICENKQRSQDLKDKAQKIMSPFCDHLNQSFEKMAANDKHPVDGNNFADLYFQHQASSTGRFLVLRNFPHILKDLVGTPSKAANRKRSASSKKKKSIKRKQHKQGKKQSKRSKSTKE